MATESDPHRVLGLAAGATPEDVRAAYRRLAREKHPDAGGTAEEFAIIELAYRQLGGGTRRRHSVRGRPRRHDEWELAQSLRVEAYQWAKRGQHHPDAAVAQAAFEWACEELEPRPVTGLRLPRIVRWLLPQHAGDNEGRVASRRQMARAIKALGKPAG